MRRGKALIKNRKWFLCVRLFPSLQYQRKNYQSSDFNGRYSNSYITAGLILTEKTGYYLPIENVKETSFFCLNKTMKFGLKVM